MDSKKGRPPTSGYQTPNWTSRLPATSATARRLPAACPCRVPSRRECCRRSRGCPSAKTPSPAVLPRPRAHDRRTALPAHGDDGRTDRGARGVHRARPASRKEPVVCGDRQLPCPGSRHLLRDLPRARSRPRRHVGKARRPLTQSQKRSGWPVAHTKPVTGAVPRDHRQEEKDQATR